MTKPYDIVVYMGRFEFFHKGHLTCLNTAFEMGSNVIIEVGSSNLPRTVVNPFSFTEREDYIVDIIFDEWVKEDSPIHQRFSVLPLEDIADNQVWKQQILDDIADIEEQLGRKAKVAIIGGAKGEWYFDLFPEFDHITPEFVEQINATDLRAEFFLERRIPWDRIPKAMGDWLRNYEMSSEWLEYLEGEFARVKELNTTYGKGPFYTCDNVITQNGQVLLVQRKNHPGKGLWAIPGGYQDANETAEEGAFRELKEETTADITFDIFKKYAVANKVFDRPNRSVVARIITSAYHVDLTDYPAFRTQAADDAAVAKWFDLKDVKKMSRKMYDDHYQIIEHFTNFGE